MKGCVMKKSSYCFLLLTFVTFAFAQQRTVQTTNPVEQRPSGKWFGVVFSDLSYVLQEPQAAPNTNKGTSGRNSFDVSRVHIGYEYTFNSNFSSRIVYDPRLGVGMQEANIQWSNIFPMHQFSIGMMQTSAEMTSERVFGYRSLGAMLFHRKRYAPEYDAGMSLVGKLDPKGMMSYSLAIQNGSGTLPDNDKLKKFAFTFGLAPDKASVLELYVDYENQSLGRSIINTKLMYGVASRLFSLGVEGFYRMERKFAGTKDIVPAGGSLFSWYEFSKGMRGVVRADVVDDNLDNSNAGYREVYLNAGIDYTPIPEVHFIPNLVYVKKLEKGSSPTVADNIVARLTAAVYFK
jgi:hypothetical protein